VQNVNIGAGLLLGAHLFDNATDYAPTHVFITDLLERLLDLADRQVGLSCQTIDLLDRLIGRQWTSDVPSFFKKPPV